MEELIIRIAYGAYSAILVALLLFLLSKGLDKKRYLRPVLIGFLVGMGCLIGFGAGIFALLIGGCTTGYLFAREIEHWGKHLRVGGLAGVLFLPNLSLVPSAYVLFAYNLAEIAEEIGRPVGGGELLATVCSRTFFDAVFLIAIMGFSAILGGLLRKALKPKVQV